MAWMVHQRRRLAGPGWLVGLVMPALVGLLVASPAVAAHPPSAGAGSVPADPRSAEASSPAPPATAVLVCLAVLALPGVLAARRSRRVGIVAAAALLIWFGGEAALHSAHHLDDPANAERCPVFSASQHPSGLGPEPGPPVLEPPAQTALVTLLPLPCAARVTLGRERARAPPARPA